MQDGLHYQVMFTSQEQAELVEVKPPAEPLGPQEVLGRTLATLISSGTELANYQGLARRAFPISPGYAAVFQVEAVGEEVRDLRPGDVAFCMGPHRSYQRLTRAEVVPVPSSLTPIQATFARMMNVTMTTVMTAAARPGEKVLVTGLGMVGHLAAQNFARCGYEVIGVDPSPIRQEIARTVPPNKGLAAVLPAVPLEDPTIARQIALAIECSGHEQALLDAARVVRKRGEVVQVAAPWRRQTDLMIHDLQHEIFFNYVTIRSGWEWELPRHPSDFRPHSIFGNLRTALNWLADGSVRVDGLAEVVTPQEAQFAYQTLQQGRAESLSFILDWKR
jgi:threonine dehydrogenase-like Zn-dependent dehydrogenase